MKAFAEAETTASRTSLPGHAPHATSFATSDLVNLVEPVPSTRMTSRVRARLRLHLFPHLRTSSALLGFCDHPTYLQHIFHRQAATGKPPDPGLRVHPESPPSPRMMLASIMAWTVQLFVQAQQDRWRLHRRLHQKLASKQKAWRGSGQVCSAVCMQQ